MPSPLSCPRCQQLLERTTSPHGVFWSCPSCGGKALGVDVLRRTFAREQINAVWRRAREGIGGPGTACPSCRNAMIEVAATEEPEPRIDVCRICHFLWFDADELARFSPAESKKQTVEAELSPEAKQALAVLQVELLAQRREGPEFGVAPPDETWKQVAALFGLPVELTDRDDPRPPWLTWSIAAAIVLVVALTWRDLEQAIALWGLIPAEWDRSGGVTFVSSFFLHGGLLHAFSNLYFLLVFGDNVEVHLGWWRYLLLIALATLAGDVCHIMVDPQSAVPAIGASGGISGIIVYYALKYPKARLAIGMFRGHWHGYFRFPAWFALILWALLQMIGIVEQVSGFSNVSAAAHLGGAAVGVLAWLCWRNCDATREERVEMGL